MRSVKSVTAFHADESGMTGAIFGLSLIPVMLMVGAAADYTKATSTRSALLQATDTAALTIAAKLSSSTTNAIAKTQAQTIVNAQPNMASATVTEATVLDNNSRVCVTAKTTVQTAFMKLGGFGSLSPKVKACANTATGVDVNTTFEIALVLDNSGSMVKDKNGNYTSKMTDLKTAANSFVDTMYAKAPDRVQFSITPFAGAVVAVDPTSTANRSLSWIDTAGNNSQHWKVFGGKTAANAAGFTNRFGIFDKLKQRNSAMDWRGCFEAPVYPRNVQDMAINSGDAETLFVPYLAPDEPSGYQNNNYVGDNPSTCSGTAPTADWNILTRACKYKPTTSLSGSFGPTSFVGPNQFCPDHTTQKLMQLTPTKATITTKVNQLVANGNTNLHEGFMWGWRTISPVGPFATARSYSAANNRKIMVFMTDGFNSWGSQPWVLKTNQWGNQYWAASVVGSTYEALGYYTYNGEKNLRLPNGTAGDMVDYQQLLTAAAGSTSSYKPTSRLAQDDLTSQACANAKAAGIEVFTIGFSIASDPIDEQGLDVLRSCATNVDHYFAVTNASQLNAAFSSIGSSLGKLRLSQ